MLQNEIKISQRTMVKVVPTLNHWNQTHTTPYHPSGQFQEYPKGHSQNLYQIQPTSIEIFDQEVNNGFFNKMAAEATANAELMDFEDAIISEVQNQMQDLESIPMASQSTLTQGEALTKANQSIHIPTCKDIHLICANEKVHELYLKRFRIDCYYFM